MKAETRDFLKGIGFYDALDKLVFDDPRGKEYGYYFGGPSALLDGGLSLEHSGNSMQCCCEAHFDSEYDFEVCFKLLTSAKAEGKPIIIKETEKEFMVSKSWDAVDRMTIHEIMDQVNVDDVSHEMADFVITLQNMEMAEIRKLTIPFAGQITFERVQ